MLYRARQWPSLPAPGEWVMVKVRVGCRNLTPVDGGPAQGRFR